MAKKRGAVETQMGGAFTSRDCGTSVQGQGVILGVDLGKNHSVTPTQTAPAGVMPRRPGTKQYPYGRSKT